MNILSKIANGFRNITTKWSKTTSVILPGGSGAIWKPRDYDTFAQEAYLTNVVSFRCIDEIAKAMESIDWYIERFKKDGSTEEVTDHPVLELMYKPNPEYSWGELIYSHIAFGIIAGNGYMEALAPESGPNKGIAKELWSIRPDRMSILVNPSTGLRTGYEYQGPSGRNVKWQIDPITNKSPIWHMKMFHPLNDFYGASAVEPAAREIDTSNEAMEWNKNLLQNAGRPGMIFTFKNTLGDTEYNRLEKKMREKYSGPRNVAKNMILEGDATVTPYGFTPAEMDFIEGNRELARRICLGFGVPPMLLGIPGDNTYSNYQEARLAFWENTVFFYMRRFANGFSHWQFQPTEKIMLKPDYDSIHALEPRRKEQFEKAEKSDFLTINEKRAMTGYEKYQNVLDEADGDDPADNIYQNASMIPLSNEMPDLAEPIGNEQDIIDAENEAIDEEEDNPKKKPKKDKA